MKTINLILIFFILNIVSHHISASDTSSNDSLRVNQNYKITLDDNSNITGTITKIDSTDIQIRLENDDIIQFQRKEIKKITQNVVYNWLLSAGFQYGVPYYDHSYPGSDNNNPTGFELSGSKKIYKNLWLKMEYELMMSKTHDSYDYYDFSSNITEHNFNILISLQKINADVFISPVISTGVSFTNNLEKYQSSYFDYYTQTYSTSKYEDNRFYASILFQGGLDIRLYKNFMISCKTSISFSIYPYFFFNSKEYIPLKIGATIGI